VSPRWGSAQYLVPVPGADATRLHYAAASAAYASTDQRDRGAPAPILKPGFPRYFSYFSQNSRCGRPRAPPRVAVVRAALSDRRAPHQPNHFSRGFFKERKESQRARTVRPATRQRTSQSPDPRRGSLRNPPRSSKDPRRSQRSALCVRARHLDSARIPHFLVTFQLFTNFVFRSLFPSGRSHLDFRPPPLPHSAHADRLGPAKFS
jgi:hypothetical protein